MKKIEVFDPPLCCPTGVCGPEVDPALAAFAADAAWAVKGGAALTRHNQAQEPLVFAHQTTVRGFLERMGPEGLPLVLVDGEIALAGRYPTRAELARWAGLSLPPFPVMTSPCCPEGSC